MLTLKTGTPSSGMTDEVRTPLALNAAGLVVQPCGTQGGCTPIEPIFAMGWQAEFDALQLAKRIANEKWLKATDREKDALSRMQVVLEVTVKESARIAFQYGEGLFLVPL